MAALDSSVLDSGINVRTAGFDHSGKAFDVSGILEKPRQGSAITPKARQAFEEMFLPWLDRNQGALEEAGTGDLSELATLCAAWARANLD